MKGRKALLLVGLPLLVLFVAANVILAQDSADTVPPPILEKPPVGPAGQKDFNYFTPDIDANAGSTTDFGGFRLIPYGYQGSIPHALVKPDAIPELTNEVQSITNQDTLEHSWLYREPASVPEGYHLTSVTGSGTSEAEYSVTWTFEGDGYPMTVTRFAFIQRPFDVYLYPSKNNEISVITTGSVNGANAVFEKAVPGTKYQAPLVIQFIQGDIVTTLQWRLYDPSNADKNFNELMRVAESLVD